MNRPTITLAAWLALCASAHAASPQDAANPAAPVPASTYQSPLADFRSVKPDSSTPAVNWRAANAAVAGPSGHAMHMNHGAAKPAADPHAGHHMPVPARKDDGKVQDADKGHRGHEGHEGQKGHEGHHD